MSDRRRQLRAGLHFRDLLSGRAAIPVTGDSDQPHFSPQCLHGPMIVIVQRAEAAEHVGDLADHEAQIGQVEWDILEAQDGTAVAGVLRDDRFAQLDEGQRHPAEEPAFELEELQVEIHRVQELGLS